jgi:hypothetical protein
MRSPKTAWVGILLGAAVLALVVLSPAFATPDRCLNSPVRCGLDSGTDPAGGCTDASAAQAALFRRTGVCAPGDTKVIYDLATPFPDNGMPADSAAVAGLTSFLTLRADPSSPCANMVDDTPPTPCPDPKLCPGSSAQPPGARKVNVTGYIVGCWTPPDLKGCRRLAIYTRSMCLHAQHELLGPGCGMSGNLDCSQVSTHEIGIDVPGAKNSTTCPPPDPSTSCRALHHGQPGFHFWIGGVCMTANCDNAATAPTVGAGTCEKSWGATLLGYNLPPGQGINEPGWYDWKTGAFKLDLSRPKGACGALGQCLGNGGTQNWDLRLIAVPRPGQSVPCVGASNACDAAGCFQ